jgi:putative addiction module component (TIGR02574 family)
MPAIIDKATIEMLSVAERLKLLDMIWDSLTREGSDIQIAEEVLVEMERRAADAKANPQSGFSMAEFEARIQRSRG